MIDSRTIRNSVASGINSVAQHQCPSGHFIAQRSMTPDGPLGKDSDTSTFVTVSVLYCLQWITSDRADEVRRKAVESIVEETPLRGLYRYFAHEQSYTPPALIKSMPLTIVPDLDTTSCVASVLRRYGFQRDAANSVISHRNDRGLFPSWVIEPAEDIDDSLPYLIMLPVNNEPCCGVNANVLMYLGDRQETKAASDYIVGAYKGGSPTSFSQWYEEAVLAYMCSRAYFEGAVSLAPICDNLLTKILMAQNGNGSCGTAIETAAAACCFLNFNIVGPELEAMIRFLLTSQNLDGSWPRGTFYIGDCRNYGVEMRFIGSRRWVQDAARADEPIVTYFGSDAITTAFCLEAISRFAATQ